MYFDVLVESLGPGTYFFESCPTVSAPFIMACLNFLGVFLHVTWMVIAFDSLKHGKWRELIWMYLGRFLFSYSVSYFIGASNRTYHFSLYSTRNTRFRILVFCQSLLVWEYFQLILSFAGRRIKLASRKQKETTNV